VTVNYKINKIINIIKMKKIFFLLFITFILMVSPAQAEERIRDYTVDITINSDAVVEVVEKITYDFDQDERHGIYREIPYKYDARGGTFSLRISNVSVANESGGLLTFTETRSGGKYIIKIGDPVKTVSGEQVYVIKYNVKRAINFFENHSELYWNAVGSGWDVPIDQERVNIFLPASIEEAWLQTECFSGAENSSKNCVSKRYTYSGQGLVSDIVFINDRLQPREGLTTVVGLPLGIIAKPSVLELALDFARDNFIVLLPVFVGILMFMLWRKKGRDPLGRQTIIAQYSPPPTLSPSELGTIIDEKADQRDISADIIYLATLGFLKIKRIETKAILIKKTDYELIKLKDLDSSLPQHCQDLFKAIFNDKQSVKISDLKDKFYKDLRDITKAVYQSTVDKGYFKTSPQKIRGRYIVFGIIFILLSWFVGPIFGAVGVVSVFISAIIIMIFGFFMPALSEKGVLVKEHILGLKDYLNVAEKDRLNFHNAPEKSPSHFEALLPFAMALSVEKAWAKQFKNIYNAKPNWYEDSSASGFNSMMLANNLSGFTKTANAAMASHPSSSASGGSGFSGGGVGGGGGGGGGGSW
jgi:uncharacterized membrane protein